jgi:hypothetical protein
MKVKELRRYDLSILFYSIIIITNIDYRFLYDRNLSCKGCSEKDEFVTAVYENRNVPVPEKPTTTAVDPEEESRKDKEIADLMAKLQKQGFGGRINYINKDLIS